MQNNPHQQTPVIDQIGVYQVQSLIGSGGMADVYRGFDTNLHRPVAIKVLSKAIGMQPGFAERFQQEARLLARLRHPHIVQVYDLGEHNGSLYMVQEFLPGPTLEQRLEKMRRHGVRLERDEIIKIISQLAGALDAAHAAGIIHRDVKPANVMWNGRGDLVLTDFGIAKSASGSLNHTQAGMVFGTPVYISPEQAQGLSLTPASDIYSLGVLLYELIAGKPPFEGDTPLAVVLCHIQEPPPPLHRVRPDIPSQVEGVVQRVLAKDPAARFGSAGEFARTLERAWTQGRVPVSPDPVGDIHDQVTRHWQPQARPHSTPVAYPRSAYKARPLESAPVRPTKSGRFVLLVLTALLGLLLLGGVFLAMQGNGAESPTTGNPPTPVGQIAPPEPSATLEPTLDPAGQPTPPAATAESPSPEVTMPPPTQPPSPEVPTAPPPTEASPPTEVPSPPPAPRDPIEQLRLLIEQGIIDGHVQAKVGDELLKRLSETERELAKQNGKKAAEKLRELWRKVEEKAREGEISSDIAQQALALIDVIASTHGISFAQDDRDDDRERDD